MRVYWGKGEGRAGGRREACTLFSSVSFCTVSFSYKGIICAV